MSLNLLAHDFAEFLVSTYSLRHDSATKLELMAIVIFCLCLICSNLVFLAIDFIEYILFQNRCAMIVPQNVSQRKKL